MYEVLKENTKLIWIESPTYPTLVLRIVTLTRRAPLVLIDNTFFSPFYVSLFLHGRDIVAHSLTKYINGHSDVVMVMGAAIFPSSSTTASPKSFASSRMHTAPYPSKFDYSLAQRGAKTLAVRMKTHSLNALYIVSFLTSHPAVEHVIYPGLASHLRHVLARTSLSTFPQLTLARGIPYGGKMSFRVCGGTRSAEALLLKRKLHTC